MRRYRDYQRHNTRTHGPRLGLWRIVLWVGIIVLVIVLGKGLLFGSGGNTTNTTTTTTTTTNANVNTNVDANANTNANTNADANSNTNTAVATTTGSGTALTTTDCAKPISQFGTAKKMALTFDGGAATGSAADTLKILDEEHVPGSFFLTTEWVKNNPPIVKAIADKGYGVYNHSSTHPHFPTLTTAEMDTELTTAETTISGLTGKTTKPYFRPPYGDYTEVTTAAVRKAGYCSILWTVDALDWEATQTADGAKQRVLDKARPGGIVLMHLGDDLVPKFLRETITELKNQGYALVSLEELLSS